MTQVSSFYARGLRALCFVAVMWLAANTLSARSNDEREMDVQIARAHPDMSQGATSPANKPQSTTAPTATRSAAPTPAAPAPEDARTISIEDEVLANVKSMEIGPITVESLALPDEFLRRVSDRVIRSSFEDRYRIIVPDPKPGDGAQQAVLTAPPGDMSSTPTWKRPITWYIALGIALVATIGLIAITVMRSRRAGES